MRADIVCALRTLQRARGVVVTVVIVLGAAIGLNATLFTVIAGMVWRRGAAWPNRTGSFACTRRTQSGQVSGLSTSDARALIGQAASLQGVGTMRGDAVQIDGVGAARALMISGNLFDSSGSGTRARTTDRRGG
jgi:hypothetical protein